MFYILPPSGYTCHNTHLLSKNESTCLVLCLDTSPRAQAVWKEACVRYLNILNVRLWERVNRSLFNSIHALSRRNIPTRFIGIVILYISNIQTRLELFSLIDFAFVVWRSKSVLRPKVRAQDLRTSRLGSTMKHILVLDELQSAGGAARLILAKSLVCRAPF